MALIQRRLFHEVFQNVAQGTAAFSPGSIAAGGRDVTSTIPIAGLAVGDVFLGYQSSADPGNLIVFGKCSAAGVATLVFENNTAGALTPTAGTTYTLLFGQLAGLMAL